MGNGTLYLIPTSISPGNAQAVVTPQSISAIEKCNYFLVENVRTARRYISSLKLGIVIENLDFKVLDKKTTPMELKDLIEPIFLGNDIGVMSEAGCPGVADPGALAVSYAHKKKINVVPLVGPSSILLALMGSGFSGQSFVFHGYLPIDKSERVEKIKRMERSAITQRQTQIFMDTPYRNNQLFQDLLDHCNGNTLLSVARDVTGAKELVQTKPVKIWRQQKPEFHKIPTIFCLYPD